MLASRIFTNNARQTQVSRKKYSTLPLSEPLPNVPKQNEIPLSAPTVTSSKLNNGVRITTVASKTSPISSIGVFLESGSRYEDPSNSGATLFLKQLAFQKTSTRSSLKLVRDIEELGATYTVSAGREYLSYVSEVSTEKLGQVIPILADVLNPQIEDYQLKETQELVKGVVETALSNPGVHVLEQLHADAFRNKGLGLPFYSLHNLEHLDVEKLNNFASQNNSADRVVIVAVGDVNHQELTEIISKSFSGLGTKSTRNKSPSEYFGGESRAWAHSSVAHIAVGFRGASWSDKDLPALSVLQFLLGSGRASTLEGPGIGFASRLNRNIVEPANGDIHQLSAFHLPYSDTGLFGFYGVSNPGKTNSMIEKLTKEISALNSATAIDSKELARAKAQSKADVLFNSQTTTSLVDYIGIHAVSKDKAGLPSDFAKAIDQVSAEDVKNVAKKVFKSKPSVSSIGDIESVPSREHIQSAFA